MIDIGEKEITKREAIAKGEVFLSKATIQLIKKGKIPKGDVLNCAQVAGILGAKKTPHLIPMCHPLKITYVKVSFKLEENRIEIKARAGGIDRTGVEMETLTAVSLAALTIYDMCKGVDKEIFISNIRLVKKTGGRSGDFIREKE